MSNNNEYLMRNQRGNSGFQNYGAAQNTQNQGSNANPPASSEDKGCCDSFWDNIITISLVFTILTIIALVGLMIYFK